MPTYEYECKDCGHRFEKFQSMTAEPLKECPRCGGGLRRLIGRGAGIILKGSGSRSGGYGPNAEPSCSRERPCCGRDEPCDTRPCDR